MRVLNVNFYEPPLRIGRIVALYRWRARNCNRLYSRAIETPFECVTCRIHDLRLGPHGQSQCAPICPRSFVVPLKAVVFIAGGNDYLTNHAVGQGIQCAIWSELPAWARDNAPRRKPLSVFGRLAIGKPSSTISFAQDILSLHKSAFLVKRCLTKTGVSVTHLRLPAMPPSPQSFRSMPHAKTPRRKELNLLVMGFSEDFAGRQQSD